MMEDSTIAIIGLGLMGGSLARAVAARGARVLGHDRNIEHIEQAMREAAARKRGFTARARQVRRMRDLRPASEFR